jgi:KRAB domain-containing zinc finger protein
VFKCETCLREFTTNNELLWHKDYIHNDGTGKFICEQCSGRYATSTNVKRHITMMHSKMAGKEIVCPFCNQSFDCMAAKNHHYISVHPDMVFKCIHVSCGKIKFTEKCIIKHYTVKHNKEGLLKCNFCERKFGSDANLSYHHDEDHFDEDLGPREFACDLTNCHKHFLSQKNLDKHKVRHATPVKKGPPAPRVACNICGLTVAATYLEEHVRIIHMKIKPSFKCNLCEKSYSTRGHLKKHKLIQHIRRELQCPHCTKTYYNPDVFKRHIESAHEQKKHCCHLCDKIYVYKCDLQVCLKTMIVYFDHTSSPCCQLLLITVGLQ